MKLITNCPVCAHNYKPKESDLQTVYIGDARTPTKIARVPADQFVEFVTGDERVYKLSCLHGHSFYSIFPDEKFELLFTSGVSAYDDSYYREAVTSVAASVERFYEFCIKCISHANNATSTEFGNSWKTIKNQSERQYGAFTFLYLITTGKTPPSLSNGQVEFRNSVVHKGIFPEKDKTIKYALSALELIYSILQELHSKIPESIKHIYEKENNDLVKEYSKKPNTWIQTSDKLSIVKSVLSNLNRITIDSTIENITLDKRYIQEIKNLSNKK